MFFDTDLWTQQHPIVQELVFWILGYTLYSNSFPHLVRAIYRKLPLWQRTQKIQGIFCQSGRDDAVCLTVMALHHSVAGAMMLYGVLMGNAAMFRHGYLLETAFEIHDYIAMVVPLYPYRSDNIKPEIAAAMCFHHAPSIVSAYHIFETDLHENPHMQWVALSLLLGGAMSGILGVVVYFFDVNTQKGTRMIAALMLFNVIFFAICRFIVFPVESFRLINDVYQHPHLLHNNPWTSYILAFDAVVYTIFNVAILSDLVPTVKLWIQRSMDGVTPVSNGAAGSSRDSILGISPRRRSSAEQKSTSTAVTEPIISLTEEELQLIEEDYIPAKAKKIQ
jgi:hypothetical protein